MKSHPLAQRRRSSEHTSLWFQQAEPPLDLLLASADKATFWVNGLDCKTPSDVQALCLIELQRRKFVDVRAQSKLEQLLLSDNAIRTQTVTALTDTARFAQIMQQLARNVGLISGWFPLLAYQQGHLHLLQENSGPSLTTACRQKVQGHPHTSVNEYTCFDCPHCQQAFLETLEYGHSINVYLRQQVKLHPQTARQQLLDQLFDQGIANFFFDKQKREFAGKSNVGLPSSQQPMTLQLFDDAAQQLTQTILAHSQEFRSFEQLHLFTAQQWFAVLMHCYSEVIGWRGWTFNPDASDQMQQQFIDVFPDGDFIDYSRLSRTTVQLTHCIDKSQQFAVPWLG